ncbi:unnamed protein product [Arctogadus glacialis]
MGLRDYLYHCCHKAHDSEANAPVPLSPEVEETETGRKGLLSRWREATAIPCLLQQGGGLCPKHGCGLHWHPEETVPICWL